jgi:peptidyl-tRNA hydrolase, PTH1 family
MSASPLKLIVGLGNPGAQYARTRHNAGFWLLDELARRYNASFRDESRYKAELARIRVGDEELWLLKPMSFMNNSGGPVQSVAGFYKIPVESILVAYDELDFPAGKIRLRQGGGAGGHNGIRDIIAQMGDPFWRLRIGIGHPGDKAAVLNYVLGRPQADDERLIMDTVQAAIDIVPMLLTEGPQKAMNRLHTSAPGPGAP